MNGESDSAVPVGQRDGPDIVGPDVDDGLKVKTAKGVAWTGAVQIAAQPLTFLVGVVLARLLLPRDFGLAGMAAIFLGVVDMVNEFGLTAAVIQKPELTEDELDSTFWTNLLIGFASTTVVALGAKPVATYFHEPRLVPILLVLSLGFTLNSLFSIHAALLRRNMQFRYVASYQFVGVLAYSVASVSMALAGAGVWSLVIGGMLMSVVPGILIFRRARWVPRRHLRFRETGHLVTFGAKVTVSSLFNYGYTNLDYLTIGRTMGAGPLGVYSLAYNLVMFPFRKISSTLVAALFPAFSTIRDDLQRMGRAYLKATRWLAMIAWPLLGIAAVLAPQLIPGLYGTKWAAAVIPFQVLCLAGAQRAVGTIHGLVLRSRGRPEIEMYWSIASFVILGACLLVGYRFGLVGIAVAVAAAAVIPAPFIQMSSLRLIDVRFRDYLRQLGPGAVLTVLSLIIALVLRIALASAPDLVRVVVAGAAALAVAVLGAYVLWRADVLEVFTLVRNMVRKRRGAASADQ